MRSRATSSGRVAANLGGTFFDAGKEDCFFIFDETLGVTGATLGEQEALAGGNLKALVRKLVFVGVREKTQDYLDRQIASR